jgi:type VI secretion system protein ImpH
LPLHITEYVRERLRNADDPTLSRFLDMLQHRFIGLFYRSWAQAQPHVGRDRPDADLFAGYVAASIGVMPLSFRRRDSVADVAKLFHASALVRHVRNAEGLATVLRHFFRVPTRVEQFVPHWMSLGVREQTALAREGATLGTGAVLGRRVWDCQHKFRIHAGPLTLIEYESFLPARPNPRGEDDRHAGTLLRQLVDWVRLYLSFELEWDLRLTLAMDEIPPMALGVRGRLGWTTWLAHRHRSSDASDLCLNAETLIGTEHRVGVSA